jgi:hypothetical protein
MGNVGELKLITDARSVIQSKSVKGAPQYQAANYYKKDYSYCYITHLILLIYDFYKLYIHHTG